MFGILWGGGRLPKIPAWERAAGAPQRGERAGSGFVWFQKCTLLTAGSRPPLHGGGAGPGAAE